MLFDYELQSQRTKFNIVCKSARFPSEGHFMVWSFGGLIKASQETVRPDVVLHFRQLEAGDAESGSVVSDKMVTRNFPIQLLGQLKIGTVFHQDACAQTLKLEQRRLRISYDPRHWRYSSFEQALAGRGPKPYPLDSWHQTNPIPDGSPGSADPSQYLTFRLFDKHSRPTGGYLSIPCLEFYSRMYGRSQEIKRILATYPWDDLTYQEPKSGQIRTIRSARERLYVSKPVDPETASHPWGVQLGLGLKYDDGVYVANVMNDPHAAKESRRIFDDFGFHFRKYGRSQLYHPAIAPWERGSAMIDVRGVLLDEGRSFLGLQIVGATEPQGPTIRVDLTNPSKADKKAEGKDRGKSWEESPERDEVDDFEESIRLETQASPGRKVKSRKHLKDPGFRIIGDRRPLQKVRRRKAKSSAAPTVKSDPVDSDAPGERKGTDPTVGFLSISAPTLDDKNQGQLRAVWESAKALLVSPDSHIDELTYFAENAYRYRETPQVISLVPRSPAGAETTHSPWCYVKGHDRFALIMRFRSGTRFIHVLDIQRRKGESFAGLVFELRAGKSLLDPDSQDCLMSLLRAAPEEHGVLTNLTGHLLADTVPLVHRRNGKGPTRYQGTIRSALRRLLDGNDSERTSYQ